MSIPARFAFAYEAVLDTTTVKAHIPVLPAAMRYSGPLKRCSTLCSQELCCSHFIVGRDHAGVAITMELTTRNTFSMSLSRKSWGLHRSFSITRFTAAHAGNGLQQDLST